MLVTWIAKITILLVGFNLVNSNTDTVLVSDLTVIYADVGERVSLPCRTSLSNAVQWTKYGNVTGSVPEISIQSLILSGYKQRFSLDTAIPGVYNLVISAAERSDAGLYMCTEDNSFGTKHCVSLTIMSASSEERAPECQNSSTTHNVAVSPVYNDADTDQCDDGHLIPIVITAVLVTAIFCVITVCLLLWWKYRRCRPSKPVVRTGSVDNVSLLPANGPPAVIDAQTNNVFKCNNQRLSDQQQESLRQDLSTALCTFDVCEDDMNYFQKRVSAKINEGLDIPQPDYTNGTMLHTSVYALPTGTESGKFLSLDLRDQTCRVHYFSLTGDKTVQRVHSEEHTVSKEVMNGNASKLFGTLATYIDLFIRKYKLSSDQPLHLGFTFSFPLLHMGPAVARLIRWKKGWNCEGVERQDVGHLLQAAMDQKNIHVKCVAVINDSVEFLMSVAHQNQDCRIALVYGYATNCCYLEDMSKIAHWECDDNSKTQMVINVEWDAFGDDSGMEFLRKQFDEELDQQSDDRGTRRLEKMVSGMYLSELVRLVLCRLVKQGLLFRHAFDTLCEAKTFYGKDIWAIESRNLSGPNDCEETLAVLRECGINYITPTLEDCQIIQQVCRKVTERSACLMAAATAAVIKRIARDEVTVAVDGAFCRSHPRIKDLLEEKINHYLSGQTCKLVLVDQQYSGLGAALAAAMALNDKSDK